MSPYLGCKIAAITQTENPFMKQLFGVNQQAIVIYRGTPLQSLKVSLNEKTDLSAWKHVCTFHTTHLNISRGLMR